MKQISLLIILVLLMSLEYFYLGHSIPNFSVQDSNLFLGELLGFNLAIPKLGIILLSLANLFLVYYLAKLIFGSRIGLISAFLYSTSPWVLYLGLAGEVSIFWVFLIFFLCLDLMDGTCTTICLKQ